MFVRIYTGEDGQSHFEELGLPKNSLERSPMQATTGIYFLRMDPGMVGDWHTEERRQYVFILAGEAEIEIGDGTVRRFGPGDVILGEDTTGRGHKTSVVGAEPRFIAIVPLAN